ncbi:reverse transcriptase domain-containing protein [Tanacetum coccineum]
MHNNIMAVGSKDRPPMLATGRYAQWRSRFLRYIDTRPNGDALRKCILEGPYTPSTVIIPAVPAMDNSPAVPEQTTIETILNMSPKNKAHFESEKEAIHLILTGIGDEIYSTVDACKTTHEMWEAIERLQQGESLNIQDVKTNLFWEFGKFTSHDGETMESYYTRFYKMMNEMIRNNLTVATMQVNSHKSYEPTSKASLPTRSHATTRHKGKEIAKPITPPSESASDEDSDPEQAQKDKEMQKNLSLIAKYFKKLYKPTNNNLRTSSNTRNKNVDTTPRDTVGGQVVQQSGIQCFNCKEFGHFAKESRKPKQVKDSTYHKEKMLLCKQAEKGVQLQAEQSDWLADTDEEIDEQELEAHYSYMAKIQEVPNADPCTDSEPLEQNDQNIVECDDERVALANLIINLKFGVDENKMIQKQLKKVNASLTQELKECKSTLVGTSRTLGESNSIRDSCLVALQNKQTEFERYKAFNDRTVDYEKLERKLNETLRLLAQKDIDIKEGLKLKAYEISVVQEKHDELVKQSLLTKSHYEGLVKDKTKVITDLKLKEEKEIDKMISMENQLKFLNEIVYKRSQSIQTIHMLAPKCHTFNGRPTFANPMYLKKAQCNTPKNVSQRKYWRADTARSSPPSSPTDMTLPISQILLAPPSLPRRLAVLVLPGQPIPIDRPYRTQTNAVHDSSSDSSSDSLLGYSSDTSSGHSIPDSPFDTSAATSAGLSHKRCMSSTTSVPIATPVSIALSPIRADLLPPRKRIRGFVSTTNFEVSSKESYGSYTEPDFDIPPTALDVSYTVELADGRIA